MKKLVIYTAGPMEHDTDRPHALWRSQVEAQLRQEMQHLIPGLALEFVHPEDQCEDHNGPNAEDVVSSNREAFKRCDAVIAYLLRPDQHGTVVELFWAREDGIPVVLGADESLFLSDLCLQQTKYWYVEEYLKLTPIEVNILDFTPLAEPLAAMIAEKKITR